MGFFISEVLFLFSLILRSGLVENILNNFCLAYLVPFIDLFREKKKQKKKAALVAEDTKPRLLWSSLIVAGSSRGALVLDITIKATLLCFSVQALMIRLFFLLQLYEMWRLNHFVDCILCQIFFENDWQV